MNEAAGHGDRIYIVLRLASGAEGLFLLDTGASVTFLDSSLAANLGKPPKSAAYRFYGGRGRADVYAAPALYLGNAKLVTGPRELVHHEEAIPGQKVLGTLGMDCLIHYCVQLDFAARRARFLDLEHQETNDLGRAFPIRDRVMVDENLLATNGARTMIDTGHFLDGALKTREFQKASQGNSARGADRAWFRTGTFGGVTYTNLVMHKCAGPDTLGLRFLARHLVTLNSPKHILYLRPQPTGSPAPGDDAFPQQEWQAFAGPMDLEVMRFLASLHEQGRLPGFSKTDYCVMGVVRLSAGAPGQSEAAGRQSTSHPFSDTFDTAKNRDHAKWEYHYTVTRASKADGWRLQRAWRTDTKGLVGEQYRIP
jgi:hypothetical protein